MRGKLILLAVVVVALVATVWLPFVNTPSLWLGLPSIMVWTAGWVVAITLVLALIEFGRENDEDDEDVTGNATGDTTGDATAGATGGARDGERP